jgi:hypothetical protein
MVSDFLTTEWGRLCDNERFFFLFLSFSFALTRYESPYREARIVFKPGKNRDGYFDSKELIAQVDRAIEIFEAKDGLAQGLFMFDNAPSHLKRAEDAISATKMVKSAYFFFFCDFIVDIP